MTLINSTVPSLLNGISQQPDSLRSPGQGEEQVNAYPSTVEGLIKRPPTDFLTDDLGTELSGTNAKDTSTHLINRDETEQYLLSVKPTGSAGQGALSVVDINDGSKKTVNYDTDAIDYLLAADPANAFDFATSGDVTIIANKEKTVEMAEKLRKKEIIIMIIN